MWFRLRSVNKVFCLNLLIQCPFHLTRKPRRNWLKWTSISCLFTRDLTLILLLVSSTLSPCIPLVKPPEPPHKSLTFFTSPAPLREVWKSLDYGAGASIWDQVLTRSQHANDHIYFQHWPTLTFIVCTIKCIKMLIIKLFLKKCGICSFWQKCDKTSRLILWGTGR